MIKFVFRFITWQEVVSRGLYFLDFVFIVYMHDYNNNIKLRIRNIIPKNVLIIWIFKMVPSDTNVFVIYVDIF